MKKAIILYCGTQVVSLGPSQSAESVATSYGVTDPSLYAEFNESDFDPLCYKYPSAFILNSGDVFFRLDYAKVSAKATLVAKSRKKSSENLAGLDPMVYMAQCSLPEGLRTPEYQNVIDLNNQLAAETAQKNGEIDAAETLSEVDQIVESW